MSKQRYINTKFWDDGYIVGLDPIEKLIFIYLLTNALTNISGVYEIQTRRIAFDTGIDKEMVEKILGRFENEDKIYYENGWIGIKNFIKHQSLNPKIVEGIKTSLEQAPKPLIDRLSIDYERLSYSNTNTNTNINTNIIKLFDIFWIEYPRKEAKQKALKSFNKIISSSKEPDILFKKIITNLKKYKKTDQWTKDDGKFIPHPTTWLNNARWEDEINIKKEIKIAKITKEQIENQNS